MAFVPSLGGVRLPGNVRVFFFYPEGCEAVKLPLISVFKCLHQSVEHFRVTDFASLVTDSTAQFF